MKAIEKETGKLIDVYEIGNTHPYVDDIGKLYNASDLDFHIEKEIDWEQRRYEIAKDVLSHMIIIMKGITTYKEFVEDYTKNAVQYADALIEELKKK